MAHNLYFFMCLKFEHEDSIMEMTDENIEIWYDDDDYYDDGVEM
ncbi:hypothetical protein GCM10022277_05870 [Litoribacillus peritrichatus]|uniref:Uncharacterized protein n=1 Tax=Litoribacillus peritrichatus TaxID=718191 RepID=A0ABP7M4Q8_9GAMM